MTDEILMLMEERREAKNKPDEYTKLVKDINIKCKKAKEELWQSKFTEIEQLESLNRHQEMHDKMKEVTGLKSIKTSSECIRDKDDEMLFEEDDIRKRWEEYISYLYNDDRVERFCIQ